MKSLQMWEVSEGESFKLSPSNYALLKHRFYTRAYKECDTEIRKDVVAQIRRELHKEVADELRPGLRIELESSLRPTLTKKLREEAMAEIEKGVREKIIDEVRKEQWAQCEKDFVESKKPKMLEEARLILMKEPPTSAQRRGAQEYLLDLEVEAQAAAETASLDGMGFRNRNEMRKVFSRLLRLGTLCGLALGALFLFITYGVSPMLGLLAPLIILFLYSFTFTQEEHKSHTIHHPEQGYNERYETIKVNPDAVASEYLSLAEKAKRARLASVPLARTCTEMTEILDKVAKDKGKIDVKYHVKDVDALQKTRIKVKQRIVEDVDVLKIFNVAEGRVNETEEETLEETRAALRG